MKDRKYFLGLAQTGKLTHRRLELIKSFFSDYKEAWEADKFSFLQAGFSGKEAIEFCEKKSLLDPDLEMEKMLKLGADILSSDDDNYPLRLREIHSPPPFLFIKGKLKAEDDLSLAVVGTRLLSEYGKRITKEFSEEIAEKGITIVSGLALGADSLAHKGALSKNSRTIAVIGSGLGNIYPTENIKLAEEIVRQDKGAVLSEFPLLSSPEKQNFPIRNRTVSGISRGVLVTEAPERSGALITAKIALDQNRDVFAIPGNIFSKKSTGTNHLIRDLNAKLVSKPLDILKDFGIEMDQENNKNQKREDLSRQEADILCLLETEPIHINDIVRKSQKSAGEISSTLSMLEIKGFVQNSAGMMWGRR